MTTALATVGLTYDGVDLQTSDLQLFLEIVQGLNQTPAVRGSDYVVPARPGRVAANRVNDVLPIVLEGFVSANPAAVTTATARSSFRANMQTVRALFAPNRARADLVATLEDGSSQLISARPLPGIIASDDVKSEFARISIELEGDGDWIRNVFVVPAPLALVITTYPPTVP
jgi:hypothetical protein